MKGLGVGLTVVFGLIFLITSGTFVFVGWQIDNEIDGWKSRAQVSSEPNDMLEYMTHVKEGMENWGMTSGNAALIFRTPENNMAEIYKTVLNHVDQAKVLTTLDRTTPEYQTGLDNLRGSIRELDLHADSYWGVHQGLIVWVLFWLSLILACIGAFINRSISSTPPYGWKLFDLGQIVSGCRRVFFYKLEQ